MKLGRIEVSGITRIVINRNAVLVRRNICLGVVWITSRGYIHFDAAIRGMLDHMLGNPAYRMWVHGDTLNIVKE